MAGGSTLDGGISLSAVLAHDLAGQAYAAALAATIEALAAAGAEISREIRSHDVAHARALGADDRNSDGDAQLGLDVSCNAAVLAALSATPTAYYASEEEDAVVSLDPAGTLAVAVDPLDGSSNVASNITIGSIFSIFPAVPGEATASFLRPGHEQLAAGYLAYGPHTALVAKIGRAHV